MSATRQAEVTFEKSAGEMQDRLVILRVSGHGVGRTTAMYRRPASIAGGRPSPIPSTRSPVEFRAIPAEIKDGEATWVVAIALPRSRKQMHYALIAEEFTTMPADDTVNERGEPTLRRGHLTYASALDFGIADLG